MASPRSTAADDLVAELASLDRVNRACKFFKTHGDEITEEQIRICEIPAPPFGEAARAAYFLNRYREIGLTETTLDAEGNCLGLRRGRSLNPLLVLSAHLDTVFPEGTDCSVRFSNGNLLSPGIADDGCGLVALIALARALDLANIETEGSILFVATVGEEGEGDLRGVRYLFESGAWSDRINAFVSFDGPDVERITNAAIGSRRYRATFRGLGGHSWGDFGVANPVNALGKVVSILSRYPAPAKPRTTFNVGRISGGTGTNVIPVEASMDVDLRSEAGEELQRLDAFFRRALRQVVDEENAQSRRPLGTLQLDLKMIGDRPLGITANATRIVKLAEQATRAVGVTPKLDRSSTDANIPISLGIPAVTLGAGGKSGKTHTLDEWYDPKGRDVGLSRGLLLALAMVGVAG